MQLVTRLTGSTKALCDHPKGRGAPQVDPDAYRIFSARKTTDRNRRRYRNRASLPGTLGRIRQGARSGYRRNLRLGAVCHPDDCEVHHHPSPYCDLLARLRDFPARAFTRSLLRGHYRHIYLMCQRGGVRDPQACLWRHAGTPLYGLRAGHHGR